MSKKVDQLYAVMRTILAALPKTKRDEAITMLSFLHVENDPVLHVPDELRGATPWRDGRSTAATERRLNQTFYLLVRIKNKADQQLTIRGLDEAAKLTGIGAKYFQERLAQTGGRFTVARQGRVTTVSRTQHAAATLAQRREEFAVRFHANHGIWPSDDSYPTELRYERQGKRRY